ncbi:MAG: hypothetical protein IJR99_02535 [Kiritimatiellae bacterium]|nr:hypothetical protein [Kiritimatiellia bacterium]
MLEITTEHTELTEYADAGATRDHESSRQEGAAWGHGEWGGARRGAFHLREDEETADKRHTGRLNLFDLVCSTLNREATGVSLPRKSRFRGASQLNRIFWIRNADATRRIPVPLPAIRY